MKNKQPEGRFLKDEEEAFMKDQMRVVMLALKKVADELPTEICVSKYIMNVLGAVICNIAIQTMNPDDYETFVDEFALSLKITLNANKSVGINHE